jgi:hypothetical protein
VHDAPPSASSRLRGSIARTQNALRNATARRCSGGAGAARHALVEKALYLICRDPNDLRADANDCKIAAFNEVKNGRSAARQQTRNLSVSEKFGNGEHIAPRALVVDLMRSSDPAEH